MIVLKTSDLFWKKKRLKRKAQKDDICLENKMSFLIFDCVIALIYMLTHGHF